MSAPIEADGLATLNRARDNLKLKPDSSYTGGHGPNPFLGPATAEDPCNNSAVTKPNDFAASVLSASKQALAVSQAISGNITKMESVNLGSAKTLLRDLAPYSEINDPEQVRRLYHYAISNKAQLDAIKREIKRRENGGADVVDTSDYGAETSDDQIPF